MAVKTNVLKTALRTAFTKESREEEAIQEDSINRISEKIAEAVAAQIVEGINTAVMTFKDEADNPVMIKGAIASTMDTITDPAPPYQDEE